jgi:ATP-dependent Lhr-like helicase
VNGYRPALLDTLLSQGEWVWSVTRDGLCFHSSGDIDWNANLSLTLDELEGDEALLYEALLKRGASFLQGLSGLLNGGSPHDALLGLAAKGRVRADSFVPIRQLLTRDKARKAPARQRVHARVMTLTAGRWEAVRPPAAGSAEALLHRAFDRRVLLCRETFRGEGMTWGQALEVLRVWEYTGRVRRGYFIEGLPGAQFIREQDFAGAVAAFQEPSQEIVWLPASDPAQPWGKSLAHREGRAFLNVPGTAVALRSGAPIAVLERQGQVLRVFDADALEAALKGFADGYAKRRLFPDLKRIVVKQYSADAANALTAAGFTKTMQDYILYQS